MQVVLRLVDTAGAGFEIERRRDRTDAVEKIARAFAHLAGQLQRDIAAEREADQECGRAPRCAKIAKNGAKVAGKAGVIERRAEVLGAAAGPHVESMRSEARAKAGRRETAYVSGIARAFQAVNHHDVGRGLL